MTVLELQELLKKFPPGMEIVFSRYSEQVVLEQSDITVEELCYPRDDGWVQDKRPDMPSKLYLCFPGN